MLSSETNLQVGDQIDGFLVKAATPLSELRMVAYQLEHLQSGARLLHLYADDAESLFSISFPTPPPDDTGLPHILEHVVLGGSRKYPVREPFFEMVKMSMATFINAMTGWDGTYYPVASNVKQDLFNLAEVYFDAVFHPLLTDRTFKREGHHFAPAVKDDPTGDLTISGIVYNEMKGGLSNPESRLYRRALRGLFPDTAYGRESGGDPERIPDLTYADFRRFYQTYYHPSNAYFLLYGDIPTSEYLAFLKDKLDAFTRSDVRPVIIRQPRWSQSRRLEDAYPIGKDEPDAEKTYVLLNWLVGDGTDAEDVMALQILDRILLGNEAAPLKKAIIDSKLGQDLIYSGYSSVGLETTFHVGLKGTESERTDAFVKLVLETLGALADGPIERDWVEAAFQQIAYGYLEIQSMFPLYMMQRALSAWIYDADPLTFLRMGEHLRACQRRYEADPKWFNRLIRERLLDNPHCLTVVLTPDRDWQARTDTAFLQRMEKVRAQFTDDEMKSIATEAEAIEREAGTPNPPEALAKLPQLKLHDLPPRPKHIPTAVESLGGGIAFLYNDVFANGVNYLHLDFSLEGLPADLWPYLPRYTDAIHKLGAAGMNYEQIARRAAACTGGIGCWPSFGTHAADPTRSLRGLRLTLKALDDQAVQALDVLHDLLFALDPRDSDRMRDVLVQAGARYRTQLVHQGSGTAARHAVRGLTPEGYLSEIVNGLPQLSMTDQLNDRFDDLHGELMDKIEGIRDFVLVPGRLTVSFTGSDHVGETVREALSDWISRMREEAVHDGPVGFKPYDAPPREGLAGPIQVAHCAQVLPAPHFSHPDEPLLNLAAHLIGLEYVLSEVRLRGNAYGAWCRYNGFGRTFELGSSRDPHVARTLRVFEGVVDYVRQTDWTQTNIERAIIAIAKRDERPIRPGDATGLALYRYLTGQTPELREQRYARILSATAKEVKRVVLDLFDAHFSQSAVCVVSSREKLEEANRQMSSQPLAIEDILK